MESLAPHIDYGRPLTGDPASGERREWLVTNGLGGFAAGTLSGIPTRRYHGLLFAAQKPPLGRTLLLFDLHERANLRGEVTPLYGVRWADGTTEATGLRHLERFHLEGTTPVFTWALADSLLVKRITMEPGRNITTVTYEHARGSAPLTLTLDVLVNHRDYHALNRARPELSLEAVAHGLKVTPPGAAPFEVLAPGATVALASDWYEGFRLAAEEARGFDHLEDHLHAATLTRTLHPGERLHVVATAEGGLPEGHADPGARRAAHEDEIRHRAGLAPDDPAWVRQLVLAADQFVVRRPTPQDPDGSTVIAGYPWFGDWGRDTMIALPGLTLATGRPGIARSVLRTFARFVDGGMLPNRFPDAAGGDDAPEYNTFDATLWYFEALRQYLQATGDLDLVGELWPVLEDIVQRHQAGTRYGIRVDPKDGLLFGGEPGVQLTWMDARVGDWVVTPRIGKPVEINALWHHALATMIHFARRLDVDATAYDTAAAAARQGFARYWNAETGGLYDVLDGPDGNDGSVRPNQIFAVSLPSELLPADRARSVVELCGRRLLTSHGLRSLDPGHPSYVPRYEGDGRARDGAYHQGTVWGWLLGPFALAHHRVFGDARAALALLTPLGHQLHGLCVGTLAEIFDGEAPHTPRGAVAQAWTVAETLRAYRELSRK